MSLLLAPEITGFLKSNTRKIKRDLTGAKKGILIQNGMPPSVVIGTIEGDRFTSSTYGENRFVPGEINENGLVLPLSLMPNIIHIIRKIFLPGGTPAEELAKSLLGSDPSTANAGIIVLPIYSDTPELEKVSAIIENIAGSLGLSVILVETEPVGHEIGNLNAPMNSAGSIIAECYQFASEILNHRERKDLRPIVIVPSKKTLTSPLTKEMLSSLRKGIIEGLPQQNWIKLDAGKLSHDRVLQQMNVSGTRAKIIGASEPFLHSGVNTIVVRARVCGNISYPVIPQTTSTTMISKDHVSDVLSKVGISDKNIEKFYKAIPHTSVCYSNSYFLAGLSKIFDLVKRLKKSTEESCEIAKKLLEKARVCDRNITKYDYPIPPPVEARITNEKPSVGGVVWYQEDMYRVVWKDSKTGLILLIPESGYVLDRVLAPYSYVFVSKDKHSRNNVLVPGVGTSEYLSVCTILRTVTGDGKKRQTKAEINHECIMERSIFLEDMNTPTWEGSKASLSWDTSKNEWILNMNDSEYTKIHKGKRWNDGWCGEYKNGGKSVLVSENHGSIYDGAKLYLSEQEVRSLPGENIAFSGSPELSGEHREYVSMRMSIMVCFLTNKKSQFILHSLGEGGKDPQLVWVYHMLGLLKEDNGLRYIVDDIGIQEMRSAIQKLPMIRFSSLVETPVYPNKDLRDFKRSITNPESKMTQFITFPSDLSQVYSYVWKVWAKGGAPLYRPPNKASGIASVVKSAKYIIQKANIPMYNKITSDCVAWAIKYGFHKLRACAFVSIRSNAIHCFSPMVNLDYKNMYSRDDDFWFGEGVSEREYLSLKNRVLREMKMPPERFAPRGMWFANNSLIGNMRSESMNDTFTLISYHMLQETLKTNVVGDCDFILNVRDFPKLRNDGKDPDHGVNGVMPDGETPVIEGYDMPTIDDVKRTIPFLGFNTHKDYADIPVVDPDTWANAYGGFFGDRENGTNGPAKTNDWSIKPEVWEKRLPKAVFRGSATGYGSGSDDNQRLFFAEMFPEYDPQVDFAITSGAVRDRKTDSRGMRYIVTEEISKRIPEAKMTTRANIQKRKRLPVSTSQEEYERTRTLDGQDQNRMILYIDGNAGAYRYTSLMRSGFCILKVDSLIGYEMWMYKSLKEALPGSNTEAFLKYTNEDIDALFVGDGDYIAVDKEGKTLRKIIEWANTSSGKEKTRLIAENSIRKYKNMCNIKTLTSLYALTLNVISTSQSWVIPHTLSKRDISEPYVAKDIIRTLEKVKKSEREIEAILMTMDEEEDDDTSQEILQRFIRSRVNTSANDRIIDEKEPILERVEKVQDKLEGEMSEIKSGSEEGVRIKPTRDARRKYHSAIKFLTRGVESGSGSGEGDLRELI